MLDVSFMWYFFNNHMENFTGDILFSPSTPTNRFLSVTNSILIILGYATFVLP